MSLTDRIASTPARKELILVHDGGLRATRTAAWLQHQPVSSHHHVRRGHADDYERVGRLLAGTAVGLVLGGGGARGAAHLGVINALEDAGIPIDIVGSVSAGAIIAGLYEVVPDRADRISTMLRYYRKAAIIRPTLPIVSLSSGRGLSKALSRVGFDAIDIEDLWTPFFCMSSSISRAESVVHDHGNLSRAIQASVALPGILPPVEWDGDLLIDGGALNNLPVDVMRERLGSGTLIAVDLRPEVEFGASRDATRSDRLRDLLPLGEAKTILAIGDARDRVAVDASDWVECGENTPRRTSDGMDRSASATADKWRWSDGLRVRSWAAPD